MLLLVPLTFPGAPSATPSHRARARLAHHAHLLPSPVTVDGEGWLGLGCGGHRGPLSARCHSPAGSATRHPAFEGACGHVMGELLHSSP